MSGRRNCHPAGLWFLFGIFAVQVLYEWRASIHHLNTWTSTTGTVQEVKRDRKRSGKHSVRCYADIVEFYAPNQGYVTFESYCGATEASYPQGTQVDVLYNPKNPHRAALASEEQDTVEFCRMALIICGLVICPILSLWTWCFFRHDHDDNYDHDELSSDYQAHDDSERCCSNECGGLPKSNNERHL